MLIGLTGGIGSGKSTVANIFKRNGIPVIDADLIAKEVVEPDKEAWQKIIAYFGKDILLSDSSIDRKKLSNIIFQDKNKRQILNNITHPLIMSAIMEKVNELTPYYKEIIVDIPLLFESKREELFDLIIVVYVAKPIQIERLMERDHISGEEALLKINAQMDLNIKKEKADIVIFNDSSLKETEQQVLNCIEKWHGKLEQNYDV